jgi:hypothetical protein
MADMSGLYQSLGSRKSETGDRLFTAARTRILVKK